MKCNVLIFLSLSLFLLSCNKSIEIRDNNKIVFEQNLSDKNITEQVYKYGNLYIKYKLENNKLTGVYSSDSVFSNPNTFSAGKKATFDFNNQSFSNVKCN
jgi:hypothetical protein